MRWFSILCVAHHHHSATSTRTGIVWNLALLQRLCQFPLWPHGRYSGNGRATAQRLGAQLRIYQGLVGITTQIVAQEDSLPRQLLNLL